MKSLKEQIDEAAWNLCEHDHDRDNQSFKAGAEFGVSLMREEMQVEIADLKDKLQHQTDAADYFRSDANLTIDKINELEAEIERLKSDARKTDMMLGIAGKVIQEERDNLTEALKVATDALKEISSTKINRADIYEGADNMLFFARKALEQINKITGVKPCQKS